MTQTQQDPSNLLDPTHPVPFKTRPTHKLVFNNQHIQDMTSFLTKLFRRKQLEGDILQTEFNRCLTTLDIILIGIGAMVGSEMNVLTGEIAHSVTGPGLLISFALAAMAHSLSIMCYAEFGTRVSKCGSIYVYSYLTLGEFGAFLVAWDIFLEDFIGTAVLARGLVAYVNDIMDNAIIGSLPEKIQNTDFNPFHLLVIAAVCLLALTGKLTTTIPSNHFYLFEITLSRNTVKK